MIDRCNREVCALEDDLPYMVTNTSVIIIYAAQRLQEINSRALFVSQNVADGLFNKRCMPFPRASGGKKRQQIESSLDERFV